ncbi:hypothetical protein M404DRAFT_991980 [Pisolithus tinctorius Marx 270]|uniref:Uncharacterized protein n=1 Tax=Pisolithus tinctorius Marx 270 TaxID=870435 RepID=A0A0C3PLS2_PISTI|nr:hypothetical protein M404DRAFT_991980 [Pisolithus tinctorius Marx 270]
MIAAHVRSESAYFHNSINVKRKTTDPMRVLVTAHGIESHTRTDDHFRTVVVPLGYASPSACKVITW